MNCDTTSNTNASSTSSTAPIFTSSSPPFPSSIGLSFDDSECDVLNASFTPELVHSTTLEASEVYNEDDAQPTFRDVAFAFGHNFDVFTDTSLFNTNIKSPVFVVQKPQPIEVEVASKVESALSSPLSPSSYPAAIDVPIKLQPDVYGFTCVSPSFTSYEAPNKIMFTLQSALDSLLPSICCEYQLENRWSINVQCLVVAEEISFGINLYQLKETTETTEYQVEFIHRMGEPLVFNELTEAIRSACIDIDASVNGIPSVFAPTVTDPWFDARQELTGRKYAIKEKEAMTLIEELNCDYLHVDTLYEVAKSIKNHCRHKGNRKLFIYDSDRKKNLLKGLKWMLANTDALARFALFVLLQYAYDAEGTSSLFATAFEKSSFALLLNDLAEGSTSTFTSRMVENVLHGALFV